MGKAAIAKSRQRKGDVDRGSAGVVILAGGSEHL